MGVIRTAGGFRRLSPQQRIVVILTCGTLAVVPAAALADRTSGWETSAAAVEKNVDGSLGLEGGHLPGSGALSVDGSLPNQPNPQDLLVYEPPEPGPQGIPSTALKAYRNAARTVGAEYPGCHIDWALIASIGRIESNHARGGYVDAKGNTLEPILGPVLNGVGPVAAIADTDGGRHDGDRVWDRAVGPTQFIPATWARYGADGNGDGVRDPNNIFDSTVATARYLCSGGLDLAKEDQLRAALYRYNNSDAYVETVIRWAKAYRGGVSEVPDSKVPLAVPDVVKVEAPSLPEHNASTGSGGGTGTAPRSASKIPTSPSGEPTAPQLPGQSTKPPASPTQPTSPDEEPPDDSTPPPDDGTTTPPPDEQCEDPDQTQDPEQTEAPEPSPDAEQDTGTTTTPPETCETEEDPADGDQQQEPSGTTQPTTTTSGTTASTEP
ncbi:lytic murein transglycosylase [Prauserella muralis]|uniref:lytic murein transglycosylase n=1 Tax=Prauserella muralis TaxID=588067 RepID=UPI0011AD22F8|nr:lytic murein transglycosylase [Prauserella muralis]TWE30373.1 transglycosylase protein with SLT domain [Prauserella muralis]